MDWNSPTTKKHIEEAEARGCRLLGAGRNFAHRLYALSCGHEQEVATGAMRTGGFLCEVCRTEKLKREAAAQGCMLIGGGRKFGYRLYALPCGHEKEVPTSAMRDGRFECRICVAEKIEREAAAQGCRVIGQGNNGHYRLYELTCGHEQQVPIGKMRTGVFECKTCVAEKWARESQAYGCNLIGGGRNRLNRLYALPCGHEQEVDIGNMRKGKFRCRVCMTEKLNRESEAHGCKLIRDGRNAHWRLYELPCGHEQEVDIACMRTGAFECRACVSDRLDQEASARGCRLIGPGNGRNLRLYLLPCGHEKQVRIGNMRDDSYLCKICVTEKLSREAAVHGCKILRGGKDARYRTYELPCGHEQEVATGSIRVGSFVCQTCEETSRTLPSNVYLIHIKVGSDEWLKLGYAKIIDTRTSEYGLPAGADVTTVKSLSFDTGNEAHAVEADLHRRYRRKRLPQKHMRAFHTKGGFEECYPITMLDALLAELEAVKQAQVG